MGLVLLMWTLNLAEPWQNLIAKHTVPWVCDRKRGGGFLEKKRSQLLGSELNSGAEWALEREVRHVSVVIRCEEKHEK